MTVVHKIKVVMVREIVISSRDILIEAGHKSINFRDKDVMASKIEDIRISFVEWRAEAVKA